MKSLFPSPGDPNWRPGTGAVGASSRLAAMSSTSNAIATLNQGFGAPPGRPASSFTLPSVTPRPFVEPPSVLRSQLALMGPKPSWIQPVAAPPPLAEVLARASSWTPSPSLVQTLPLTRTEVAGQKHQAQQRMNDALSSAWSDALSPTGVAYQVRNNIWPIWVKLDAQRRGPQAYIDYLMSQSNWYRKNGMPGAADAHAVAVGLVRELWRFPSF